MCRCLVLTWFNLEPAAIERYRQRYHAVFKGHKPVFTHGNLRTLNVMLRDDGTVVIIDWETSGWYPSCWEYCCLMTQMGPDQDWGDLVPEILDEYVDELACMASHRDLVMFGDTGSAGY